MPTANRWIILCIAIIAQIATASAMFGVPFVLPALRDTYGLNIAQAGTLAGLPGLGLLSTLVGWGVIIDRYGERVTMSLSLFLTASLLLSLHLVDGPVGVGVVLALVGAAGGPVNAASGRLVLGLFAWQERGLAMGLRQAALPLGLGMAAAVLPAVAQDHGFVAAMTVPAALALVVLPLVVVLAKAPTPDEAPEQQPLRSRDSQGSPYRRLRIWRVHSVSMLLAVPQFTVTTYSLVYLVEEHGWAEPAAGALIAVGQVVGALARMGAGAWSDRAGSRLGPVRLIAVTSGSALLALTIAALVFPVAAVVLLLSCLVLGMAHNGLMFTAVAETAGMVWAGRAMAIQNSLQAVSSTLTPMLMGVVIQVAGFAIAFGTAAAFCGLAAAVVPLRHRAAQN
ncbi:MFS transporter [Salinactinospora qingdaonensis]|uniref:MFS transporter n=1 Tax=Salinactinospora qingdaonensis TaxID=702744 RepID=A0ABP7EW15_9ACTN